MTDATQGQAREERPQRQCEIAVVRSDDLLAGRRQLLIDHQGELYRLLLTKNGKLVLQK